VSEYRKDFQGGGACWVTANNQGFFVVQAQDPPRGAAESEPTKQQDPDPKSPTSKDDAAGERD
jgi:hypothetical protein